MSSLSTTSPATFTSDATEIATLTEIYQLRPMRREELDGLSRSMSQIFAHEVGRDETWRSDFQKTVIESMEKYFHHNNPHGLVNYVCEYRSDSGTLHGVGCISMQTSNEYTTLNDSRFKEVECLFVHPQHRKKGIASEKLS